MEFALIVVIFLNFTIGAVEMMCLFSAWSTLQWACDGAARATMISSAPSEADAVADAQSLASSAGYDTSTGISFSAATAACGAVHCITITGSYTYVFKLSTLGLLHITVTSQATAPLQN